MSSKWRRRNAASLLFDYVSLSDGIVLRVSVNERGKNKNINQHTIKLKNNNTAHDNRCFQLLPRFEKHLFAHYLRTFQRGKKKDCKSCCIVLFVRSPWNRLPTRDRKKGFAETYRWVSPKFEQIVQVVGWREQQKVPPLVIADVQAMVLVHSKNKSKLIGAKYWLNDLR